MSEINQKLQELLESALHGLNMVSEEHGFSLKIIESKGTWYFYPEVFDDDFWKDDENTEE